MLLISAEVNPVMPLIHVKLLSVMFLSSQPMLDVYLCGPTTQGVSRRALTADGACTQSDCGTPTKERSVSGECTPCADGDKILEQRLEDGLARSGGGGWRSFVTGKAANASAFDVESGSGASSERPADTFAS